MRRPIPELAILVNQAVRAKDEWFEEPDDVDRLNRALATLDQIEDPVLAAAVVAFRVTRAQAFGERNKRTALLLARWTLDHNGIDGTAIIPPDDRVLANLLVQAAAGIDVEAQIWPCSLNELSPATN